jgi:hypothetical protein
MVVNLNTSVIYPVTMVIDSGILTLENVDISVNCCSIFYNIGTRSSPNKNWSLDLANK